MSVCFAVGAFPRAPSIPGVSTCTGNSRCSPKRGHQGTESGRPRFASSFTRSSVRVHMLVRRLQYACATCARSTSVSWVRQLSVSLGCVLIPLAPVHHATPPSHSALQMHYKDHSASCTFSPYYIAVRVCCICVCTGAHVPYFRTGVHPTFFIIITSRDDCDDSDGLGDSPSGIRALLHDCAAVMLHSYAHGDSGSRALASFASPASVMHLQLIWDLNNHSKNAQGLTKTNRSAI